MKPPISVMGSGMEPAILVVRWLVTFDRHGLAYFYFVHIDIKVGSHDPIFLSSYYSDSKELVMQFNISMNRNNARKIIGSKNASGALTFRLL